MDHSVSFAEFGYIAIPTPTGSYVPYCQAGEWLYLAGQTCSRNDKMMYVGQVGIDLSIADAQKAARICMENVLAALYKAVDGQFDRVVQCVKVNGYVNS